MTLRRGFKAEAERQAGRVRAEMGLASHDRLDPRKLAAHLEVTVVDASTLVDLAELEELERLQLSRSRQRLSTSRGAWSSSSAP